MSGVLKLLRYTRMVGQREIPFAAPFFVDAANADFTGERQHDLNLAVVNNLTDSIHWASYIAASPFASGEPRSIQALTLIDGLDECVDLAVKDYRDVGSTWEGRLWSLIRVLPMGDIQKLDSDLCFRRSRTGGGTNESCGSFLKLQLQVIPWLPSTLGPSPVPRSFLCLSTRHLISRGANEDEIGDKLLHYLVASDLDTYQRLFKLGVEPLEDSESASPMGMARFLEAIGARLSDSQTREAILSVKSRWRAVRGAIQEIYRTLNQLDEPPDFGIDTRFAARLASHLDFLPRPLFFAEPGSAIERSFSDTLAFVYYRKIQLGLL